MKTLSKLLTLLAIMIASSMFFASCDNTEDLTSNVTDTVTNPSETSKILMSFNDSILKSSETRGKKVDKWIEVAVADAEGAAAGITIGGFFGRFLGPHATVIAAIGCGTVLGAAASYTRYNSYESVTMQPRIPRFIQDIKDDTFCAAYTKSKELISISEFRDGLSNNLDSCSVRIGIIHNRILDELNGVENEQNQSYYINTLSDTERQIFESPQFINKFNSIISGNDEILSTKKNKSEEVFILFRDAVTQNVSSIEDLSIIVRKYSMVVNTSNGLNEEEKQCLLGSFAVMYYSYKYWSAIFEAKQ